MVSSKRRDDQSCIDGLRQSGALKLLFPRSDKGLQGILINTAGGITGGDRFHISATAGTGSELTLTTQAAERAYRAQAGQVGRMTTELTVRDGASLCWLPQETILYEGSALSRQLNVEIAGSGRFLMIEPVLFGRKAMGEEARQITFRDRVSIRRRGALIYRDGVRLTGDVAGALDRPAIGGGARAMANLVLVSPDAEAHLATIRARMAKAGGASLLRDGVLVARLLAADGFELRQRLVPILDHLTDDRLPPSWRL